MSLSIILLLCTSVSVVQTIDGQTIHDGSHIVLSPQFAASLTELRARLSDTARLRVTSRSTLVIDASDVKIQNLDVDGALLVTAPSSTKLCDFYFVFNCYNFFYFWNSPELKALGMTLLLLLTMSFIFLLFIFIFPVPK